MSAWPSQWDLWCCYYHTKPEGTATCKSIPVTIGASKVILVDSPGFDDPDRTDAEILEDISRLLSSQYQLGVSLKGVIYLHRITDVRYQRSAVKTLNIFKEICGEKAFPNVILATTRWSEVTEAVGAEREKDLRSKFWTYMLHKGAYMTRFHGDKSSGVGIVGQLLGKSHVVLDLQRELVDEKKVLDQTAAGAIINDNVNKLKAQYQKQLADLEELRRSLIESDQAMKRKIQEDWEQERNRLRRTEQDQERLRKEIAQEVRAEINNELAKTKKSSSDKTALIATGLVSTAVRVVSMFLGVDSGLLSTVVEWFSGESISSLVDGFFANFSF